MSAQESPHSAQPVPMLRRPRLDVPVFSQRDGTIRLGWNPDRSFVVTPPPGVEYDVLVDLLRRLDGVHSRAHTIWYAGTVGMSANAMSTLLAELVEAELLVEGRSRPHVPEGTTQTVVYVVGRGPLADAVVAVLPTSSSITVRRSSSGAGKVAGSAITAGDVAVLTDDLAPDPHLVTELVRARTPHVQVRLRDGTGVVGPFVIPGTTSCLRCADLTRGGLDPQWPHISAQLLGSVGHADKPTVLAAAAVVLGQIHQFVRDRRPSLIDTTVEIDLRSHVIERRRWTRHPHCDCAV
ncbi:hypothetical protein [Rhodococcoides fascians]|uniref:hypothetical protein n=1 Tax=Rhodococcoides fascians TaxID=1828 RepID=UPI000566CF1D|nr:hypothetical protein [Rhodococcus fascians]